LLAQSSGSGLFEAIDLYLNFSVNIRLGDKMPLNPGNFREGLKQLKQYMNNLYEGLDGFIGQFDKNGNEYKVNAQYKSALKTLYKRLDSYVNGLDKKISEIGKNKGRAITADQRVINEYIGQIFSASGDMYAYLDPAVDGTNLIKGLYTNRRFRRTVSLTLFKRCSITIRRYYLEPIKRAMEEAARQTKAKAA